MRSTRSVLRDLKDVAPVISMVLILVLVVYIKWGRCRLLITPSFYLYAPMASRE